MRFCQTNLDGCKYLARELIGPSVHRVFQQALAEHLTPEVDAPSWFQTKPLGAGQVVPKRVCVPGEGTTGWCIDELSFA